MKRVLLHITDARRSFIGIEETHFARQARQLTHSSCHRNFIIMHIILSMFSSETPSTTPTFIPASSLGTSLARVSKENACANSSYPRVNFHVLFSHVLFSHVLFSHGNSRVSIHPVGTYSYAKLSLCNGPWSFTPTTEVIRDHPGTA